MDIVSQLEYNRSRDRFNRLEQYLFLAFLCLAFSFLAFSCLAFSCHVFWCRLCMSRIFTTSSMVPHFHVSHFQRPHCYVDILVISILYVLKWPWRFKFALFFGFIHKFSIVQRSKLEFLQSIAERDQQYHLMPVSRGCILSIYLLQKWQQMRKSRGTITRYYIGVYTVAVLFCAAHQ